jgi:hypothetical protein
MDQQVGATALIWVTEFEAQKPTINGAKDAVTCNVLVLSGPMGAGRWEGTMFFQTAVVNSLKHEVGGGPVLAVINQGKVNARNPSWAPPFLLGEGDDNAVALATAYLRSDPSPFAPVPTFAKPASPAGNGEGAGQSVGVSKPKGDAVTLEQLMALQSGGEAQETTSAGLSLEQQALLDAVKATTKA